MEKSAADSFSFEPFKSPLENPESEEHKRCSIYRFENKTILHILKKVTDLKTLCRCRAVTKKIASIAILVDTITFTTPLIDPNPCPTFHEIQQHSANNQISFPFQSHKFKSAMKSLQKFKLVKSLYIQLPSSCLRNFEDYVLLKWKLVFGNDKAAPYVFIVILNTITDSDGNKFVGQEPLDMTKQLFVQPCVADAISRQRMLSVFFHGMPLLENVSISDNVKRGRISVSSGRIIHQLRNDLGNNTMETMSWCKVPLLKLPVSGYEMKGVTMFVLHRKSDRFENIDFDGEFEDEEERAYTEAMKEIVAKHRGKFKRLM